MKRTAGGLVLRRLLALLVLAGLGAGCGACSPAAWGIAGAGVAGVCIYAPSRWNHAYHTKYQKAQVRELASDTSSVQLGFVEFDDFGWLRDTMQARVLLDQIQVLQARTNVAVIVYAHGWRHNAKDGDSDVESFKATIRHLGQNLNDPLFRSRRRTLTHDPNLTIFGIYVGWRGKAWPELGRWTSGIPYMGWLGPATIDLPVYMTSFSRKDAAGVVGFGDVRSFLLRLDDMHREINAVSRRDPVAVKPLGLVYVGHSYGGHLMFSALSSRIEDSMASAIAGSAAGGRRLLSQWIYPTTAEGDSLVCQNTVQGVGDLVVLVNPAIEASAYLSMENAECSRSM